MDGAGVFFHRGGLCTIPCSLSQENTEGGLSLLAEASGGYWQELQRKDPRFLLEGQRGATAKPGVHARCAWKKPVRGDTPESSSRPL